MDPLGHKNCLNCLIKCEKCSSFHRFWLLRHSVVPIVFGRNQQKHLPIGWEVALMNWVVGSRKPDDLEVMLFFSNFQ